MKKSFLKYDAPWLTAMIQCPTPEECIQKIEESFAQGAEAFGIQLCKLLPEYQNEACLSEIFAACQGKPIYITSYRSGQNKEITDDERAELLLKGLRAGATLCDMMGDMFDPNPKQMTFDETAVAKQKQLVDTIHQMGGEVLISTHDFHALSPDEVFALAKAQAAHGADIVKIVITDDSIEQLPGYIEVLQRMVREIPKPVLFLTCGPCGKIMRRIGPDLGSCMYLCVSSYNKLDTLEQPLLEDVRTIRKLMRREAPVV